MDIIILIGTITAIIGTVLVLAHHFSVKGKTQPHR